MPRKGENIYKRKDSRWEARYIKGRTELGKAKYGYVYGKTYKEAKEKRAQEIAKLNDRKKECLSKARNSTKLNFEGLTEKWLSSVQPQIKPSTYNKYRNLIDSYLIPELKDIRFSKLTTEALRLHCNHLLEKGGMKKKGLSSKTVSDVLSLLRRLLSFAESLGIDIPCTGKEFSIKQVSSEICILCRSEQEILCQYLLRNLSERNMGILLTLFTGLRIGELCALRWSDISLSNGTIYIHKIVRRIQIEGNNTKKTAVVITTPKSRCSIRTIPIPDSIVHLLNRSCFLQEGYFLTGIEKRYLEPRTMQNHFKRVLEHASVRPVNFHSLRHTFATRCVEVGFDIKSLSEILGHASVTITMNRYVHPSMELKRENMQRLSEVFIVK